MKDHLVTLYRLSTPVQIHHVDCAMQQARDLATPQSLLQSAAMSVMRHAARTGCNKPQISNKLAGQQF
jgi:hypothetical protein